MKIEVSRGTPLRSQQWVFVVGENSIRLCMYREVSRPSTRHKFRGDFWDASDERSYYSRLKRPTEIPEDVIAEAWKVAEKTRKVYIGWFNNASLYK